MTTCEHNTSTVQADHGNVKLSECDWGCGAILISIERDGITRTLTADEAWELSRQVAALEKQLDAAGEIFAHFGGLGELMQWENAQGESAQNVVNAFLDAYIEGKTK